MSQTRYLGPPLDADLLTNLQLAVSWDSYCTSPSQQPDTCAQSSDHYCHCQDHSLDTICGLSCVPGTQQYQVGGCVKDDLHSIYMTHYQCFTPVILGVTDAQGNQTCQEYVGPNPPPGVQFSTLEKCLETWATCAPGFERALGNINRPGCYAKGNYSMEWNCCDSIFDLCSAHDEKQCGYNGNDNFWKSTCSGNCAASCYQHCYFTGEVPPYHFYCANGHWAQNQSMQKINIDGYDNSKFQNVNDYCNSQSPYNN